MYLDQNIGECPLMYRGQDGEAYRVRWTNKKGVKTKYLCFLTKAVVVRGKRKAKENEEFVEEPQRWVWCTKVSSVSMIIGRSGPLADVEGQYAFM